MPKQVPREFICYDIPSKYFQPRIPIKHFDILVQKCLELGKLTNLKNECEFQFTTMCFDEHKICITCLIINDEEYISITINDRKMLCYFSGKKIHLIEKIKKKVSFNEEVVNVSFFNLFD